MTLILGAFSKNSVVLTADGKCIEKDNAGKTTKINDNYQKIFPIPDLPIAIVHHGQNVINKSGVREIINDFLSKHANFIKTSSLHGIANKLISFLDSDAKQTLKNISEKTVIGFWIAGFSYGKNVPEIQELWWEQNANVVFHSLGRLAGGGDGQEFIKAYTEKGTPIGKYNIDGIVKNDIDYLIGYHAELYKLAEIEQAKKGGEEIFGGHKHQLVIIKSPWNWIVSP